MSRRTYYEEQKQINEFIKNHMTFVKVEYNDVILRSYDSDDSLTIACIASIDLYFDNIYLSSCSRYETEYSVMFIHGITEIQINTLGGGYKKINAWIKS